MDMWISNPIGSRRCASQPSTARDNQTKHKSSLSMFRKKTGKRSMFSEVGSSMPDIAQSMGEEINLVMRAGSCDNLNDLQLDMADFEKRSPFKAKNQFILRTTPLERSASAPLTRPNCPPRPPRPSWMKKTPKKQKDEESMFQVFADDDDDELIQPYARLTSIRTWALQPRSQSSYNARHTVSGPTKKAQTRKPSVYGKEYVWGKSETAQPQHFDHAKARTTVREMCTPRKQRPTEHDDENPLEGKLMEVLEDISSDMAASGSWHSAAKIARDQAVVQRVQTALNTSKITPDEASAVELLTALLSCFDDNKEALT
eukprot:m.57986 g.57986  ORF g.57986 m.57986 type:complete len:315 (+) comp22480_c0_seq2:122-1066(+)